jgi:hypothetical protein
MVASEHYPELKATQQFHDLSIQIEGTENRILRSRQEYNKVVAQYNTELGKIHGQVTNAVTGHPFQARLYFEADASAKDAPNVANLMKPAPVAVAPAPAQAPAAPAQPTVIYVQAPAQAPPAQQVQYAPQPYQYPQQLAPQPVQQPYPPQYAPAPQPQYYQPAPQAPAQPAQQQPHP